MCGINGFIRVKKQHAIEGLPSKKMSWIVRRMNENITHRGPNSEGIYEDEFCALGMRRLSVIDLNTGEQPIYNSTRDKLIFYNGEIYNFKELKEELRACGCDFYTSSDTEVILQGYEKYGEGYFSKLEGMYAFCIYDIKNREWILVRDRTGEKPLYYYNGNGYFMFGSELKSLIATGLLKKEIDEEALTIYFQLGYIPAPLCIFKGVRKLPQACYMKIGNHCETKIDSYWKFNIKVNGIFNDYSFCKTELKRRLFKSVENRMESDVPLGAFLSGGIDSSIIVGIMSRLSSKPVETFTIGFKEKKYDESPIAEIVAKKNGTKHHNLILDWNEAFKDIDTIMDDIDEPFADPSFISTYVVSKLTRQYVTVALTGDAGDELFAGYDKYLFPYYQKYYRKIPGGVRRHIINPILQYFPLNSSLQRKVQKVVFNADLPIEEQAKRLMCRAFSPEDVVKLLSGCSISKMGFINSQFHSIEGDDMRRIQYVDYKTVLEGQMLFKVDRASMLASLETRAPILDTSVVELAFSMPSKFKINKSEKKLILKDAFRDILPEELLHVPKHGFGVPIGYWLENGLRKELLHFCEKGYIDRQGLFDSGFIREYVKQNKSEDIDWSTHVWSYFVFQRWYERYFIGS